MLNTIPMDAGIDSLMMWAETEPLVREVEAGEPFKANSESWGWPGLVGSGGAKCWDLVG